MSVSSCRGSNAVSQPSAEKEQLGDHSERPSLSQYAHLFSSEKEHLRPAFHADFNQMTQTNVGDKEVLKFDNVMVNYGDGYKQNTGKYSAPVPGEWQDAAVLLVRSDTVSAPILSETMFVAARFRAPSSRFSLDLYRCYTCCSQTVPQDSKIC